jgi:DNA-binding response OmpR family regulator
VRTAGKRLAHPVGVTKLLLVDDEKNVLVGLDRYFRVAGFQVDCAREREEAEAMLADGGYDAVLVDLSLTTGHGPDGLGVVQVARDCCPRARIVVLTALGSLAVQQEAYRLGADAFLQKPRPLEEIRGALEGWYGTTPDRAPQSRVWGGEK